MIRHTFAVAMLIFSNVCLSEESETGGGYDYKAVEKAEKQAKDAAAKKARIQSEKIKLVKEKKESTSEYFKSLEDDKLCVKIGTLYRKNTNQEAIKNAEKEVVSRGFSIIGNYDSIKKRNVNLGMNECELLASWGRPERRNRSVNAYRTSIQYVYGKTYVYTDNGVVTSWQD